jgi:hypothetical protein
VLLITYLFLRKTLDVNLNFKMIELNENKTIIKFSNDEKLVLIKPASWKNLDNIIEYQKIILSDFLKKQGAIGSILAPSNTLFWNSIQNIFSLLNFSQEFSLNEISEIEDIQKLFITTNTEKDLVDGWIVPEDNKFKPSLISVIHGLDFYLILRTTLQEMTQKEKQS